MKGIDYWRLADELTIVQAALLICGFNPTGLQNSVMYKDKNFPEGYVAIKHALTSAVQSEIIPSKISKTFNRHDGEYYPDEDMGLISVEALKRWMQLKGIRQHFFFFPEEPEGEFLSKSHPRYSPKLAAAVRAWQAMDDEKLHAHTPKQSVKKWLRIHGTEYDLTDEDGKTIEGAIEEIAKIVNWSPKGGAPSTPSAIGNTQPNSGLPEDVNLNEKFSVLKEKTFDESVGMSFDADSVIPF